MEIKDDLVYYVNFMGTETLVTGDFIKKYEKIYNKKLEILSEGEELFPTILDRAKMIFKELSDDERLEVMNDYCSYCGSEGSGCQCWNDE